MQRYLQFGFFQEGEKRGFFATRPFRRIKLVRFLRVCTFTTAIAGACRFRLRTVP